MICAGRRRWASVAAIATTILAAEIVAVAAPDPFDACTQQIVAHPHERDGYSCLIRAGQSSGSLADLPRRFEAMIAGNPDHTEARRALGLTLGRLGRQQEAAEQLVLAAEEFMDSGNLAAECESRTAAARYLTDAGLFDEATAQLERGEAAAQSVGEDRLHAIVNLQRGWTAVRQNDYVAAGLFMRRAEDRAFPDGPLNLRGAVVDGLAAVDWLTGRFDAAIEHYRQQIVWAEERGEPARKAHALGNLIGAYRRRFSEGHGTEEELAALAREALAAAKSSNSLVPQTRAHLSLAIFGGPDAADHARQAVDAARASGVERAIRGTLSEAGYRLVCADPNARDEGFDLLDESLRMHRDSYDLDGLVRTLALYRSAWSEVGDLERTLDATERLFAAIEKLRDLQHDGEVRARSFATHSDSSRRAIGYLLERLHERPMDFELADRVLGFLERARSRVLLDYLDATGVTQEQAPSGELAEQRREVLDEIAQVQRRLLESQGVQGAQGVQDDRARSLEQLAGLELEEQAIRGRLAKLDPEFGRLRRPEFPDLQALRDQLADDEALVIFQLSTADSGGSWALAIDAAGVRAHPLGDARQIRRQVSLLQGSIDRRDGSEGELATWLGRNVLAPVVDALPDGVRRLQLVPDGILWQLPFDALRLSPGGAVTGAEYDIELSPSATLWHRWRAHPADPAKRSVLALADPAISQGTVASDAQRSSGPAGVPLGNLPFSRREAKQVVGKLGEGGRLFVDDQASERRLKETALGDYAILHFAAHAIVDDENPARSAVLLAPGAEDEDGLLQPREIVALDLRDKLILLSTCRSASGTPLAGEGPMSLARAFLQGDARAVIGSLWPLRDDDALVVMDLLAAELSRGEPLGRALANARRQAAGRGLPTASWAGLVMLGDGNWTVPARPASRFPRWSLPLVGGAVLAAFCWLLIRIRRILVPG